MTCMVCWVAVTEVCIFFLAHIVSAAKLLAPGVEQGQDGAYVDCPCAHPNFNNVTTTLPQDWGSWCQAWNIDDRECKDNEVEWCGSRWCYVVADNCTRSNTPSTNLFDGFSWSYTTCGNLDTYTEIYLDVNKILPIYAGDLSPVAHTRASLNPPQDSEASLRAMEQFAYHVLMEARIYPHLLSYRALSNETLQRYPSWYTGCVYDIALGNLDMCIGDWYFTPVRARFGVSFIAVYTEDIKLIVHANYDAHDAVWDMMQIPLAPFSPRLWALLVGTVFISGLVLAILEGGHEDSDFARASWPRRLANAFTLTFMSFTAGSATFQPRTPGGKLFTLGITCYMTIALAFFTANTAAFFITEQRTVSISSIHQAESQGLRICYTSALHDNIVNQFPAMKTLGVKCDSTDNPRPVMVTLQDGNCDAAISVESKLRQHWALGELCEFTSVGNPLVQHTTGFYVVGSLYPALAHAAATKMSDRTWAAVSEGLVSQSICPWHTSEEIAMVLQPAHMLLNCCILGLCGTAALIMHTVPWRLMPRRLLKRLVSSGTFGAIHEEASRSSPSNVEELNEEVGEQTLVPPPIYIPTHTREEKERDDTKEEFVHFHIAPPDGIFP